MPDDRTNASITHGALVTWRRAIGVTLGLALLAAAAYVILREHHTVRAALDHIAQQPTARRVLLISTMLGSVALNIMLTAMMFRLLLSRYGSIGRVEMKAVIASATLMNYLPLRPGFVGRVAYHKAVNSIAVRDSIRTVIQAAALSTVAALYLTAVALVCRRFSFAPWMPAAGAVCVAAVVGMAMRRDGTARALAWALSVRLLDVLVTAMRYHAAFALIGSSIDWTAAIAFACISVLATMVPLVSNGLGLREWAIGLLAPAIAAHQMELGITADLMIRGAELVIALALGVPATAWLARRLRSRSGHAPMS